MNMIPRAVVVVASSLALHSAARAQQAVQPAGPLILIEYAAEDLSATEAGQLAYMVSDLPAATPRSPVTIRFWVFMERYQGTGGAFNTIARRQQIDCAAGTLQARELEFYNDGAIVRRVPYERPVLTPPADSVEARTVALVCNPSDRPGLRFSTPATARQAVNERFHSMWLGE